MTEKPTLRDWLKFTMFILSVAFFMGVLIVSGTPWWWAAVVTVVMVGFTNALAKAETKVVVALVFLGLALIAISLMGTFQ